LRFDSASKRDIYHISDEMNFITPAQISTSQQKSERRLS
jgi:hypothetical protein